MVERVVVGECLHRFGRGRDQPGVAEPQGCAPQARHAFDEAPALLIDDVDAVALDDDQGLDLARLGQVGVGVQVGCDILVCDAAVHLVLT